MGKFGPPSKWLRDQREVIPLRTRDLSGRTFLVVGANIGLGLEASRHLAAMKCARLIMACRNNAKGQAAVKDVKATTANENVELAIVDLTDFASIRNFVDDLKSKGVHQLDSVLVNAGMMTPKFTLTKDGWETTLQTNYLGTCLLCLLLLPLLLKTPHEDPFPRLTFVGSEVHYFISKVKETKAPNILDALNDPKKAVMSERYYITKLFLLFFARSLASKVASGKLTVTSINPGFCKSGLIRNSGVLKLAGLKLATALLSRSTEIGSRCLVHGMIIAKDSDVHGKYLNNCRVEEESDFVISEEGGHIQKRLWDETVDVMLKIDPRVNEVLEICLMPSSG